MRPIRGSLDCGLLAGGPPRRESRIAFWASAGMFLSVAMVAICFACSNWAMVTTGTIGPERVGAVLEPPIVAVGLATGGAAFAGAGTCRTSIETTSVGTIDGGGL